MNATLHADPAQLEQARFNMIEQQIRPWEVLDARVLELLARVRREDFVPAAHRALAFADMELPLGAPSGDDQRMLAPKVQARLVQDLALQPSDRVLEIGTGSGFTAALLGSLAQRVVSVEIDAALADAARERLQRAGVTNVEVRHADAMDSDLRACRDGAPYNAILLSGSVAEVPAALQQLLAVGGRLVAIVGQEPVMRATVITRTGEASFQTAQAWDTVAARLRHFPQPSRFVF